MGSILPSAPDRDSIRQLLSEALPTDADLEAFVLDFFPHIHQRFSDGMQRTQKVTLLLTVEDNCVNILEKLRYRCPEHSALRKWPRWQTRAPSSLAIPLGLAAVLAIGIGIFLWRQVTSWHRVPAIPTPTVTAVPTVGSEAPRAVPPVFLGPNSGNIISNSPGAKIQTEVRFK